MERLVVWCAVIGAAVGIAFTAPAYSQSSQAEMRYLAEASYSVRNLQASLNALGHNAGPADGLMGPSTRGAIASYQQANGMAVTGQASNWLFADIQSKLRARVGSASAGSSTDNSASASTPSTFRASARDIAKVQRELNERGYDAGPADGVLGPNTRSAIREYRAAAGLTVNEQVDENLLARLDRELEGDRNRRADRRDGDGDRDQRRRGRLEFDTVLNETFSSNANSGWQINEGQFFLRDGVLWSKVGGSANAQSSNLSSEEAGQRLIGQVLGSFLGMQQNVQTQTGSIAALSRPTDLGEAFRMQAEIHTKTPSGKYSIGAAKANGDGYRVIVSSGSSTEISLVAVDNGNAQVLGRHTGGIAFVDGKPHTIELRQGRRGALRVAANGEPVIQVRPVGGQEVEGELNYTALVNYDGEIGFDNIKVRAGEPQ